MDAACEKDKLRRFLYVAENERFLAGNPETHFLKDCNLEYVNKLLNYEQGVKDFVQILNAASRDDNLPKRITLIYVLAYALIRMRDHSNKELRTTLADESLKICKTDEEFFKFISIFTELNKSNTNNKITTAVGRAINHYIESKSALQYAESVGRSKGYHGWKYKDLIKLSHFKSKNIAKSMITAYVLFGLEKLKDKESEEMKNIYELLEKRERLKKTLDEAEASTLVSELKADFSQVNPKLVKSEIVWSAIVPELTVREVLRLLPKFFRFCFLKSSSSVHRRVVESLTSLPRIKACNLNPIEVFIYMKDFEKGGKPLDPKLVEYLKTKSENGADVKEKIERARMEPKCAVIKTSLEKCLNLSYSKDPFTMGSGKKIVLALDMTDHPDTVCFKNKNITCLEAEVFLALYYFKTEKNLTVMMCHNKDVKGFNLDKSIGFTQNLKKIQDNKAECMNLPGLFDWALSKKKEVDVFICLVQSFKSLHSVIKEHKNYYHIKESFLKYRKNMSSPSTKLVVICPGTHNLSLTSDMEGCLSICGFCPEIPKLVKAFVQGTFS